MARNIVDLGGDSKIVFDWGQFSALRRMGQTIAIQEAEALARRAESYPAPSEWRAEPKKYSVKRGRWISASVAPQTKHAAYSNAKHNTLVKLLGGGK